MGQDGLKILVVVSLFGSILGQNETVPPKDSLFHDNSLIHLLSNITEDHLSALANAAKVHPDPTGKLFGPAATDDTSTVGQDLGTAEPSHAQTVNDSLSSGSLTKVKVEAKVGLQESAKNDVQSAVDSTLAPGNGSNAIKPEVSSNHVAPTGVFHPDPVTSGAGLPPHVLVCNFLSF